MYEGKYYLTVDKHKRQPQNDGYVAVISLGSPQVGSDRVEVLDVTVAKNMKAAKAWYKEQMLTKPWEVRN